MMATAPKVWNKNVLQSLKPSSKSKVMNPRGSSGLKRRCKRRGIKPGFASAEALSEGGLK
jgi:hypothetical protein